MKDLLYLFIVLNIANVVLNTVKSLITIKGGAFAAALINAITYFVYTYVLIYTNSELPMFTKAAIVAICNFIGVYAVKKIEEWMRKDKLWKVEATVQSAESEAVKSQLTDIKIPFSYINIGKYVIFNVFCDTSKESALAKMILERANAKYFVSESKIL